jgi:YD repeat-containing protein
VYDTTSAAPFITGTGALLVGTATAPTLSFTNIGGNQLQFSWTGGGNLQAQTNSLTTGLGTNWVNYPGSSPVTITIDPTKGCVFFRVKQ